MKFSKSLLIALSSMCLLTSYAAEVPANEMENRVAPADNMPTDAEDSAENQIQAIIDKCGLLELSDQNKVTYASATASIGKSPTDPKYADAVVIAFEEALQSAKRSMANSLTVRISRTVSDSLIKGQGAKPTGETSASQAVLDGIRKKMIEKMTAEGVDLNNPEAVKKAVDKIKKSKEFKDSIKAAGECFLMGFQVFKTVATKKQVGVLIVHNDRLMGLAESMFTNNLAASKGVGGAPLRSQIPNDNLALLNTYGVRLARDEQGNDWLLCYVQASVDDPEDSQDAYDEAETSAAAQFRSFAGEKVAYSRALVRSKSTVELEKMGKSTDISKDFKQESKAVADELEINGITSIYKKTIKMASGHYMAIAVFKWSPAGSAKAQQNLNRMNQASGKKRQSGDYNYTKPQSQPSAPAQKQYKDVRHTGEGATGLLD